MPMPGTLERSLLRCLSGTLGSPSGIGKEWLLTTALKGPSKLKSRARTADPRSKRALVRLQLAEKGV